MVIVKIHRSFEISGENELAQSVVSVDDSISEDEREVPIKETSKITITLK